MVKRRTPIRHKVRSHKRLGDQVQSYQRGSGIKPKRKRKVVNISGVALKDASSDKVKRIIRKAASKSALIIFEECNKLGIRSPKIEWVGIIKMGDKLPGGVYQDKTQTILLSTRLIKKMLEMNIPEPNIVKAAMHMYFHEFKHYIDHKAYGVTMQDIKLNREKYEAGARSYAEEIMKKVK